ncbi:hypothetical protein CLHUN_19270 [Ruminiclostridium hungatei]|uniref:Uncharacterized protein n=1 Tax=Ruminiclostridium hungatei TaxID=48256 RepID=A0A1V4SJS0_RUMHU|nr:hypothetical protein [Ruminiclostridium hungatei]OPX44128.1 hypothetical protein CLHUN_19270 [Ruminiclostridium hungatei]
MDKQIKLKLSNAENKYNEEISSFSLSYSGKRMENPEVSYRIISALKADASLFIELNSSLLNMDASDKKKLSEKFMEGLKQLGIEYLNKKTVESERRRVLSISLEGKKVEGFETYALIPGEIWCQQEFKELLPSEGLRYYLSTDDSESNLSAFADLDEEERLKLSRMVIFDNAALGSMGINTAYLTKSEINRLLE